MEDKKPPRPVVDCSFYESCGNKTREPHPAHAGHLPSVLCDECRWDYYGYRKRL